jgi:hypothetical protein
MLATASSSRESADLTPRSEEPGEALAWRKLKGESRKKPLMVLVESLPLFYDAQADLDAIEHRNRLAATPVAARKAEAL